MLHHKRIWLIVVLICALLGGSALAGELSGGFDDSSISLVQGESARVSGWAQTSGAGLTRVTLTVDGYHTSDGNDRYASREFGGETSISLQDYGEFTLDSSSAPLNEPGSYTVHLWAADEEGSKELAKMKVTVEAPPVEEEPEFEEETWEDDAGEDYVEEYSEEEYVEDESVDEPSEEEYVEDEPTPAPLPVEINGGLDSDHVEVTLGELATVDGWVEVSNGTLNRVTLTVSGYQTGDGNDRYASREFGGESSIELGNYVEFTLDTTREPLNQPGSYTVNLWAAASDGSSSELGSMAVDVVAPPEPEPEPEPEPGTEPEHEPDPNAVILEGGVALSGGFDEDSVELRVGESRRVAGEVSVQGGSLAQVTYQIDGWSGDDENNRYCTQEVSDASSVKLENMAGLVLDANAAPLNEPGEYTLHLVARAASGEFAELDAMTVSILPQDIAAPTYSPEEGGATVRATGDAYVRTAPDKDSPDMGSVGAGTELPYLGESQTDGRGVTWYKVSFGGAEAWISSNVSQRSIDSSKHSPEEPPKPAPAVTGGTSSGTVYITGDINARLAPDPDGDILCTISSGTTLEYLGETSTDYRGIDWYRASYNGNAVWLSSKYAELEAEQPAPEPVPEPEEVAIAGEFSDDSIEMTVGQRMLVAGNVSASGDVLAQITYQIDGWSGTDANNRYCTQAVDGLQSVQLTELSELILDGTTAPLNQPGEYTLRLIASTSNGSWQQLDSMAVMVKGMEATIISASASPLGEISEQANGTTLTTTVRTNQGVNTVELYVTKENGESLYTYATFDPATMKEEKGYRDFMLAINLGGGSQNYAGTYVVKVQALENLNQPVTIGNLVVNHDYTKISGDPSVHPHIILYKCNTCGNEYSDDSNGRNYFSTCIECQKIGLPIKLSIAEAAEYVDYPKSEENKTKDGQKLAQPVIRGRIRYIPQMSNDPDFCPSYWKNDVANYIGTNKSNGMCTYAAYSMALSYLGIDCTPIFMKTGLPAGKSADSPKFDNVTEYLKNSGYNLERIPNGMSFAEDFVSMFSNYQQDVSYSPVYLRYTSREHPAGHAFLIIGKKEGTSNTYTVLDPNFGWSNTHMFNLDINIIANKDISFGNRTLYTGDSDFKVQQIYQWKIS